MFKTWLWNIPWSHQSTHYLRQKSKHSLGHTADGQKLLQRNQGAEGRLAGWGMSRGDERGDNNEAARKWAVGRGDGEVGQPNTALSTNQICEEEEEWWCCFIFNHRKGRMSETPTSRRKCKNFHFTTSILKFQELMSRFCLCFRVIYSERVVLHNSWYIHENSCLSKIKGKHK